MIDIADTSAVLLIMLFGALQSHLQPNLQLDLLTAKARMHVRDMCMQLYSYTHTSYHIIYWHRGVPYVLVETFPFLGPEDDIFDRQHLCFCHGHSVAPT